LSNKIAAWAVVFALSWAFLRWFERANLYIPGRTYYATPASYGIPFDDAEISTSDGEVLRAWWVDAKRTGPHEQLKDPSLPYTAPLPRNGQAPVLVYFHGNGGNISSRLEKLRIFRRLGLSVLLFDYRGYGSSSGRPSERGTYLDGRAVVNWLAKTHGISPASMIFYGESLGCAVALETALHLPPRGLIMDSGFSSTIAMGKEVFPWLPVKFMVRYHYDNLKKMPSLKTPLLIVHSPEDDIVPFKQAQENYSAATQPKSFLQIRGNHNSGYLESQNYGPGLRDFIAALRP
jgi:fermentation-respiration switch protein FrsA (DUF1100 family)